MGTFSNTFSRSLGSIGSQLSLEYPEIAFLLNYLTDSDDMPDKMSLSGLINLLDIINGEVITAEELYPSFVDVINALTDTDNTEYEGITPNFVEMWDIVDEEINLEIV